MVRCGFCSKEIQAPVCPLCLMEKFESWIERKKFSLTKPYREEVRNIIDKSRYGRISCSVCRSQHEKGICVPCFAGKVHNWLASKDEKLAEDFVADFSAKVEQTRIFA